MAGSMEPRNMMSRNGRTSSASSSQRRLSRGGPILQHRETPCTGQGKHYQPEAEEPGTKQPQTPGQQRDHSQARRAQAKVDGQPFRDRERCPEPKEAERQLTQPQRRQCDETGEPRSWECGRAGSRGGSARRSACPRSDW